MNTPEGATTIVTTQEVLLAAAITIPLILATARAGSLAFRLALPLTLIGSVIWMLPYQRIEAIGWLLLALLLGAAWWAIGRSRKQALTVQFLAHLSLLGLCAAALLHLWPGIDNLLWLDKSSTGEYGAAYRQWANLDKAWVGIALLWALGCWQASYFPYRKAGWPASLAVFLLAASMVFGIGLASGLIVPDVSANKLHWLLRWALVNLLLTCLVEEVVFRRYLLETVRAHIRGPQATSWAIAISSLIFGLAHFPGGPVLVLAATLMGGVYGWIYTRHGLWSAVLAHFAFNLIHLLVFSYPYAGG